MKSVYRFITWPLILFIRMVFFPFFDKSYLVILINTISNKTQQIVWVVVCQRSKNKIKLP